MHRSLGEVGFGPFPPDCQLEAWSAAKRMVSDWQWHVVDRAKPRAGGFREEGSGFFMRAYATPFLLRWVERSKVGGVPAGTKCNVT